MSETLTQTEFSGHPMATSPSTSPYQTMRVASTQTTLSPPPSKRTIVPITALSPYQNRWTICARVTAKPPIHTYHNRSGKGRVLNVQLCDESGQIQAVAFNDVADKLDSVFESEKIYYVSRGKVKLSNKAYAGLSNKYELFLSAETEVELCLNIPWNIPQTTYHFTNIGEIEKLEADTIIDVIGVCYSVGELKTVMKGANKVVQRNIYLLDKSEAIIACTLWHSEAEAFDGTDSPVVAVKGCKVSHFGGRSLSCVFSTQLSVKPDIPQARELQSWFSRRRRSHRIPIQASASNQPPYLSLGQVRELEQAGIPEGGIAFCTKATILYARSENCVYKACPSAGCNKKLTDEDERGQYRCKKCNQLYTDFKYRMILAIEVADYSTDRWLTCFNTASILLGKSANELAALRDEDKEAYDKVFSRLYHQEYIFTVRANCNVDSFVIWVQEDLALRLTPEPGIEDQFALFSQGPLNCICTQVRRINYVQVTQYRVEEIKELLGGD